MIVVSALKVPSKHCVVVDDALLLGVVLHVVGCSLWRIGIENDSEVPMEATDFRCRDSMVYLTMEVPCHLMSEYTASLSILLDSEGRRLGRRLHDTVLRSPLPGDEPAAPELRETGLAVTLPGSLLVEDWSCPGAELMVDGHGCCSFSC